MAWQKPLRPRPSGDSSSIWTLPARSSRKSMSRPTVAPHAHRVVVIGSGNASNSRRLVEAARKAGAKRARLIENAGQIDWTELDGVNVVALSAGASAPEVLVAEVITAFRARYALTMQEEVVTREDVEFRLPRALQGA